jgi:hypothetical protein
MPYLRLRQVCLVTQELDLVVNPLCQVLGLQVCHRDPGVERFGLHIALDNATQLNFAAPDARHAVGFSAVTLRWPGARAAFESAVGGVVVRARALGCLVDEKFGAVKIGGVWWQFESETFK